MAPELWFTADLHFGHKAMATTYRSGFAGDVTVMNEMLVVAWNDRVQPNDDVWILGDLSFLNPASTATYLDRLRGNKHMVWGNHDRSIRRRQFVVDRFASVQDYKELKIGDERLVLFHFPLLSWHQVHHGSWHLHGHCHGNMDEDLTMARMDVGVDTRPDFAPWSYDEIATRLRDRDGRPADHHQ